MTANTSLERRVAEHYASEPLLRAPDRVLHAALASIDTTKQRRGLLAPWRFTNMNTYAKVAAAAVVAIALGAIALWQVNGPGQPGPTSTPIPTPTAAPNPSLPPPLTETFTSNMHGITMAYPEGWSFTEATTPWTTTAPPLYDEPSGDDLFDPVLTDQLFLEITSQPLAGASGPAWADTIEVEPCPTSAPIVVDGADGRLLSCDVMAALFWTAERGYLILLFRSSDEAWLDDVYNIDWFQQVLDSVQILPPDVGTADMFIRPFDYVLPGAPVFDYGSTEERYWEVRVPAYNDGGHPGGLIVQAPGGGLVDPCDGQSAVLPLDPGADSVMEYLRTIPALTVTNESDTMVDGRPAKQITVRATAGGADCPEPWVWAEAAEPFLTDLVLRLVVVDVDGEHVTMTVYGEPENPELPSFVDRIIGSFNFAAPE